jgi:hypothetical protein
LQQAFEKSYHLANTLYGIGTLEQAAASYFGIEERRGFSLHGDRDAAHAGSSPSAAHRTKGARPSAKFHGH